MTTSKSSNWRIRDSHPGDGERIIEIWAAAVDATHDFLTATGRLELEREVRAFLPTAPLRLAIDQAGQPAGFMLLSSGHLEALFVHPDWHRSGAGSALLGEAIAAHPDLTVDVNEQNLIATHFYERRGFSRVGRSSLDGAGRPYPLLHLRAGEAAERDETPAAG